MTKQQFLTIISDYVASEKANIAEHAEIAEILKAVDGKPIDRRTFNEKRLGKYTLQITAGLFYIKGPLGLHLIGYNSSPFVSAEKFEEFDSCAGRAAAEKVAAIEAADLEKAYGIFSEISEHYNRLRELFGKIEAEKLGSYHFAPYYDVLNFINGADEKRHLSLSDFYFIRK